MVTRSDNYLPASESVEEPRPAADVVRLPIHSELVSRLRDAIIEGEFPEGSRLSERFLCERLEVSRSPLREALKAVAAEGLIDLLPNRGARVAKMSIEQLRDTFNVVAMLETNAARIACDRATEAQIAELGELHFRMAKCHLLGDHRAFFKTNMLIHEKIVEAAGNPVLLEVYRTMNARIRRFRFFSHQAPHSEGSGYHMLEDSFRKALDEHWQIFEALQGRDANRIQELIQRHYLLDRNLQRLQRMRSAPTNADAGAGAGEPDSAPPID